MATSLTSLSDDTARLFRNPVPLILATQTLAAPTPAQLQVLAAFVAGEATTAEVDYLAVTLLGLAVRWCCGQHHRTMGRRSHD